MVDVDEFFTWYDTEVAGPIRRALEKLRTAHGKFAADLVLQGLQLSEKAVANRKRVKDGK